MAGHEEHTVVASMVGGAVMFAASLGVPLDEVWAVLGVGPDVLADPDARVPYQDGIGVFVLLHERFPGRPIGLEHGQLIPDERFGPVAYMARNASTLRAAIDVFVRYQTAMSSHIRLGLEGDVFTLEHTPVIEAVPPIIETAIVYGARLLRTLAGGEVAFERVTFKHPEHAPREAYEAFFGCPVVFRASRTSIAYAPGALDRRIGHANATVYAMIQQHVERTCAALLVSRDEPDIVRDTRAAIVALSRDGDYRAEAVADRMEMGIRKLQRALKDHGTTLRDELDSARRAHAERLLGDASLSLDDVAFLVGYAEERSFNRAFKRWTGRTPAQFRRG